MDQTATRKQLPRLALLVAVVGAVLMGVGAFLHWGFALTALDDGLSWPITDDTFPHGYLFLAASGIGLALLLLASKGATSPDTPSRFAILSLIVVLGDAIYFLVDIEFDLEFAGPGIFVTSAGALAYLIGTLLVRRTATPTAPR